VWSFRRNSVKNRWVNFSKQKLRESLIREFLSGANAPRGAYPWLAALGYRTPSIRFLCGGTLITQKHVLTAAHCNLDNLIVVRLGAHDMSSSSEGAIDFNIETKVSHENYDPKFIINDISMIKLVGVVNITNFIRPICIPFSGELASRDYTGSLPWVAGWGSTSFRGPVSKLNQIAV
jgi:serine protease 56